MALKSIFCLIFILFVSSLVSASPTADNTTEITNCSTESLNFIIGYPWYIGVNETNFIYVQLKNSTDNIINSSYANVQLNINGTALWYNFTYYPTEDRFKVYLFGNVSEDAILVAKETSTYYVCNNETIVIKFRIPYYATFHFYAGTNSTNHEATAYTNQFNYVYLYNDTNTAKVKTPGYLSGILEFMALVPGSSSYYKNKNPMEYDRNIQIFFWSDYVDGEAKVKLYDIDAYVLNILGADVKPTGVTYNEFNKPKPSSFKFQTQAGTINFSEYLGTTPANISLDVYLQPWEANKTQFYLNMVKYIFIFVGLVAMLWLEISMGLQGLILAYSIIGYILFVSFLGWLI